MFGVGDALEHEPERDVAEKFAVGNERGISLCGGRGEEDWRTASVRKSVNAEDVALRALGRSVAANQDYGNLRLAKAPRKAFRCRVGWSP